MLTQKDVKKQFHTLKATDSAEERILTPSGAIPNSAMSGMLGASDASSADLDSAMRLRLSLFSDNQIGTAEHEAEQMATSVSPTSNMDEVKAQMGERMGADFSGVRFHEGGSDEAMATGIGARAYTVGRDVYFGAGGFDPQIAAHELTHTVQQGAVEGMASTSAPMGAVQMSPFSFIKNLFGGKKDKKGSKGKSGKKEVTKKPNVHTAPVQIGKVPESVLNPKQEKRPKVQLTGDGAVFSNALDKLEPTEQASELQKMRLYLEQKEYERGHSGVGAKLSDRDLSLKQAYDEAIYKHGQNNDFRKALLEQTRKAASSFNINQHDGTSVEGRIKYEIEYAKKNGLSEYVNEDGKSLRTLPSGHSRAESEYVHSQRYEKHALSDDGFDLNSSLGLLDDVSKSMDKGAVKNTFDIERDYNLGIDKTPDSDNSYTKQVYRAYHDMLYLRSGRATENDVALEAKYRAAKNDRYTPAGLEPKTPQQTPDPTPQQTKNPTWISPKRKTRKPV